MDFLCRIFDAVIKAGARTINVPDTVGYSVPSLWYQRIHNLIERVDGSDRVIWSTHCHNDLGMAVANSLAAVEAGARQVECTINGLGERAGNASLEEVVMALKTRVDIFGLETGIDSTQIVPTSKLVSSITGYPVQPNKAIVGANAFSHAGGLVAGNARDAIAAGLGQCAHRLVNLGHFYWLCRGVYPAVETRYTTEYCDRRCQWSDAAGAGVGGGDASD